jgi:two-component system sensor histidine kinase AlgZ
MFALIVALLLRQVEFLTRLGAISLYCQWIALMSTAALCVCSTRLNRASNAVAIIGTGVCCLLPALLTEFCSQFFVLGRGWNTFDSGRFWSYSAVAFVITILVIRLFSILALIELRNKAEMSLRIQALQSRIRPHFLFNSLRGAPELFNKIPSSLDQLSSGRPNSEMSETNYSVETPPICNWIASSSLLKLTTMFRCNHAVVMFRCNNIADNN